MAEQNAPESQVEISRIQSAQQNIIPAGALPNPKFFTALENFPISGTDAWQRNADSMTMQKFGVMQDIPSKAKRQARIEIANAELAIAQQQWPVIRISIKQETAKAWFNLLYTQKKLALYDLMFAENKQLGQIINAQIASGHSLIADSVLSKQEATSLDDQHDELLRDLHKASIALSRYITPIRQQNQSSFEADMSSSAQNVLPSIQADKIFQHLDNHPDLQVIEAQTRLAKAKVANASALKNPDWGLEVAYQRRARQFGDMISAQLSFELPVFSKNRIDPLVGAALSTANQLIAEREVMLREHQQQLDNQLSDLATIDLQLQRATTTSIALIEEKLNLQLASYKAGKVALTEVLATRRELLEQRLRIITLQQAKAVLSAQIYFEYSDSQQISHTLGDNPS